MSDSESQNVLKLDLSSSPHIHSKWETKLAMRWVILSLIPSLIASVIFFGPAQLLVIGTTTVFAIITESAIKYFRKQRISIADGSAAITGLLLGLILPPNFSLVHSALGSIVAIGLGKEIFGGLGFNIFNPALVGRAFLQAAFPVAITTWEKPNFALDTVTTATPLSAFKFDHLPTDTLNMLYGNIGGSLGETSAIAVLIGGIFLIALKVVNWRIPVSMILGVIIFGGIFWLIDPAVYPSPLFQLFAGGFLFGTFFMATDWVTSPITAKGMWIFGFGISFVLIMIRLFGGLPEGVMYAILFMNALVPIINRFTQPKVFGKAK